MSERRWNYAVLAALAALTLAALVAITAVSDQRVQAADESAFEGPVARADCGPGARLESALQGQVPKAERESGASKLGTRCNLEMVGRFQGEGASWVSQSYKDCAYMSTRFPSETEAPGVQVIDVADPANPKPAGTLTTPAMQGTWETLKVNEARGLLAAVSAPNPAGNGAVFFDVYDIKDDCRKPKLLNSLPLPDQTQPGNVGGHEGDWSPDGKTYWATLAYAGTITAIDVVQPEQPRIVFTGRTGVTNHGFGFSADGNRLYIAEAGRLVSTLTGSPPEADAVNGLKILDVSDVQSRRPAPQLREVSTIHWEDGAAGQHTIPISYGGRPYLVFVDELGEGAARIIDIADEKRPRIVSKLKLEIQMPEHAGKREEDTVDTGVFGYDAHYCSVDRQVDPTMLACGYFQSGVRVFDIREVRKPRELAYFNPPAQTGRNAELEGSEHASSGNTINTDWCSSPPRFVGDQLWVTCQDNGFMVLRFTNGAVPPVEKGQTGPPQDLGLPPAGRCVSKRNFVIRLRAPKGQRLRTARVLVGGRRVKVRRSGGRLRARVDLRGRPKGTVTVRIVARTAKGRTVRAKRRYRTCTPGAPRR